MKKLHSRSVAYILALTPVLLTSCAKTETHASPDEKRQLVGDLGPAVEQLASGKYLTTCDRMQLPKMLEIARAVDLHKTDVDGYASHRVQTQNSKRFKFVPMGPIVVRENLQEIAPDPGWQVTNYSWKEILVDYETALNDPTPENWYYLNSSVRGLLVDDQSRIVDGYSYFIGHADEPMIQGLLASTQKCSTDAACTLPIYADEGMNWLLKQKDYANLIADLKKSSDHSSSETNLATLERWLKYDLRRFEMRKNEKITRNGSMLTLPLYAGVFSGVTEQLSKYIESVWKSPALSLHIDWQPASPDLFTLLLSPDQGGRSYVEYNDRRVVLFNEVKAKSIAHEIGHVIGFRDRYFDLWDESHCQYQTETRAEDLMSDSGSGLVTEDEWQTLLRTYPE